MEAIFSIPTDEDNTYVANRLVSIENLIKEEYSYSINTSLDDLKYLQQVIDDELIDFQNEYALECLGAVFGRVLIHNFGDLDWWVVEDTYGRSLVVRYKETSLQIAVLQLIGKRLSRGEIVDVKNLYDQLVIKLDEIKDNAD